MELSEEEKKAIEFLKEIVLEFEKCNSEYVIDKDDKYGFLNSFKVVINVIEKQQKEIDFYKKEELGYIAGYEDGKRHKQTAVAIKNENAQQELFQKEIERLNFENYMLKKWNKQLDKNCISKDKIKEKIKELETLYNCNLDTAMTSYEMFVFVRSYIDKVKNCLNEL